MICFENIIGNSFAKDCLSRALRGGRVSHSYIINGESGTGRGYIARAFAKALLCTEKSMGNCNCNSCVSFESFNNPDVIYVRLQKDRKTIGIDQIRQEVIKPATVKPFLYSYKIFIIYDADKMTAEAQNGFLKTLEEPEPNCKFILISSNYANFLPTIISRCVLFKLRPIPSEDIRKFLEQKGISGYKADMICEYSDGSLKKAQRISEGDEFFEMESKAVKLIVDTEKIEKGDTTGIYRQFEIFEELKDNIDEIMDISLRFYDDIISYKAFGDENRIHHKNRLSEIKYISSRIDLKKAVDRFEALFKASIRLKQNANYSMTIETMLFELKKR